MFSSLNGQKLNSMEHPEAEIIFSICHFLLIGTRVLGEKSDSS